MAKRLHYSHHKYVNKLILRNIKLLNIENLGKEKTICLF